MDIYIDNKALDTDQTTNAPLNIALSSVTDVATGKIPFSKTIKIPDTPCNRHALGYTSEIFSLERFNNGRHPARIEQDGFVVMQGAAQLSKVEKTPTGKYFHMNLIGNEIEWIISASETQLSQTELGLPDAVISDMLVRESLNTGFSAPYRLIPIQKGKFVQEVGDQWQDRTQTMLSDYAPFFHLATLFRAVFAQSSYSVVSNFMDGGGVAKLYVSGRWKKNDPDELDEKYGFKAGRFVGKEIGIGTNGVEAVDVGNIVETADPDVESPDGEKVSDVYNNGSGFQMIDGKPFYIVPEDMTVGLLYSIHYYSPVVPGYGDRGLENCQWLNRIEIPGIDGRTVIYDATSLAPNFNADVRKSITQNTRYYFLLSLLFTTSSQPGMLMLGFLSSEGEHIPGDSMIQVVHKKKFTTSDTTYGRAYLYWKVSNTEFIEIPDSAWKIVEVPFEVEITAKIYFPAIRCANGRQIPINAPAFRGLTFDRTGRLSNMNLSNDSTVETYFSPQVSAGDAVSAANMLAFDQTKQLDFIKGVKQLFNLYLYTDPASKKIYIEPRDDFYSGPVLDWTDKVDYSKEIEMEELGGDLGRNFVLSYKEGDLQVAARNENSKTKYAQFTTPILNTVSKNEDYTVANEFFTPAIIRSGGYSAAKDAALLLIGDPVDTDNESPYTRDMAFEPKIIEYRGLQPLPAGQQWAYPSGADTVFPVVGFQDDMVNLGFDGENGMNRYYRGNVELYNHGRRLTLSLYLQPRDIEPLIVLNEDKRDFRATVLLRIDGEDVLCKLEEIKDFDPAGKGSTRCVLITG